MDDKKKYYTVLELAQGAQTYKKRVERYLEAHKIEPDYRDGKRGTKYYNENVKKMIDIDLNQVQFVRNETTKEVIKSNDLLVQEVSELNKQLREKNNQINGLLDLLKQEQERNKRLSDDRNSDLASIKNELETFLKESNKNMTEAQKSLESTKNREIEHVKHIQELENTINELKEENQNLKQQARHEPKKRWFQFWK